MPSLYPVPDTNAWKWVLRKSRCWVPAETCQFDFEAFKALKRIILLWQPGESISSVCVSWAVTHFKHTLPRFSPFRDRDHEVRRLQVTRKQQRPSSGCLSEGNLPALIPTRTFTWSDRPVCVCVTDGCRLSTNDTLSESQQDGRREHPAPLFCPSLSTPIKGRNLEPKYIADVGLRPAANSKIEHFDSLWAAKINLFSHIFIVFTNMCWGLKGDGGGGILLLQMTEKKSGVGLRSTAPTIDAYLCFQPLCVSNDKKD